MALSRYVLTATTTVPAGTPSAPTTLGPGTTPGGVTNTRLVLYSTSVSTIDLLLLRRVMWVDAGVVIGQRASKAAALGAVSWAKGAGVVDVPLLPDWPM
jgi:hypothetical protein